eukprot:CAMPEP_0117566122 /NCGR_PEP_ID=MMETSP0784-20121206/56929_1 /TAXON_ID=39447 /ORGANISM="" /LENGTH=102 /DNA_ID=CAMNT_0005363953 /DNA_START=299 /DNA_END=607 /DNA_ORIENTATION=-
MGMFDGREVQLRACARVVTAHQHSTVRKIDGPDLMPLRPYAVRHGALRIREEYAVETQKALEECQRAHVPGLVATVKDDSLCNEEPEADRLKAGEGASRDEG